jgi:hypothetical protein
VDALAGPYAVSAVLLVVAGVLEARRPQGAVDALATLGLSIPSSAVRFFAVAGSIVGLVALGAGGGVAGRVAAVLVGLCYLGFAGFVGSTLTRGDPLASCGCFGRDDTPPNLTHLVLNVAGFVAAIAVVLWPGGGIRGAVAHQPGAGLPFVLMTVVCAGLAYVVFTLAPREAAHPDGMRGPRG